MATQDFVAVLQTGSYHVIKAAKELTDTQANLRPLHQTTYTVLPDLSS